MKLKGWRAQRTVFTSELRVALLTGHLIICWHCILPDPGARGLLRLLSRWKRLSSGCLLPPHPPSTCWTRARASLTLSSLSCPTLPLPRLPFSLTGIRWLWRQGQGSTVRMRVVSPALSVPQRVYGPQSWAGTGGAPAKRKEGTWSAALWLVWFFFFTLDVVPL